MGWVHPLFRQTLLDNCDEYIDSSDHSNDKTQSKLITKVSKDIADNVEAANEEILLPSDLEKCVHVWFGNYASGNAKEERSTKSKSDIHIFADRISKEHKILSNGGEKDIGKYHAALSNVFEVLNEEEKAVLRQFIAAARKYYKLTGCIPWLNIAENPLHHLTKRSRPDSDYKLKEPSHMKSDGVDSWLRHWLKLQKKNKCPLVLKEHSDKQSDHNVPLQIIPKGKGKSRAQDVDSKDEEETNYDGDNNVFNLVLSLAPPIGTGTNVEGSDHIK
ncbi:hypothetical protein PILCRDRAFT_9863 [Piloderma croceum F 1598]|uniref:Uncharacterized protein n=1 Tax=Piloderma croceum (strain F 1598) TaxID=765440 RepID=A0A0C3F5J3_PILCF|nr:hypothetical protein PILCRDRAFT_9863 [Piloderma croceum F 1598]